MSISFRNEVAHLVACLLVGTLIGCPGSDNSNLRGNVTLDDQIIQGVGVRVDDGAGTEAETTTDVRGEFGFVVAPGVQTVSIISGIPVYTSI